MVIRVKKKPLNQLRSVLSTMYPIVLGTIGSQFGAQYNWCSVQLVPSTIYSFPVFNARTRPPGIPNQSLHISQKTEIFWFCFVSCSDMIFLLPYLSIFPLKILMAWLIKFSPAELSWRCPGKTWSSQYSVESPLVVNPGMTIIILCLKIKIRKRHANPCF